MVPGPDELKVADLTSMPAATMTVVPAVCRAGWSNVAVGVVGQLRDDQCYAIRLIGGRPV